MGGIARRVFVALARAVCCGASGAKGEDPFSPSLGASVSTEGVAPATDQVESADQAAEMSMAGSAENITSRFPRMGIFMRIVFLRRLMRIYSNTIYTFVKYCRQ